MWCDNGRVDNELVRTCRRSGLGSDDHCDDKDGKNDIGALCRHLLRAHGIQRQLRAALYVSNLRHEVNTLNPASSVENDARVNNNNNLRLL